MLHHRSYQSILPTHNKLLQKRWDETYFQDHRRRVKTAIPMVSTAAPRDHPHVVNKLKKQQRESERCEKVQRDNNTLMLHMRDIMKKGSYVDHRNTYNHWSLNYDKRANELQRIQTENIKMLGRIQSRPPNYCVSEWVKDRSEKERLIRMITTHPSPQAHSVRPLVKTDKKTQSLPSLVPPAKEKRSSFIEVSDTDTIDFVERDLEIASRKSLQISKSSIDEIKAICLNPPQICITILEAYAILFKHSGERMYEKARTCFSLKNITSFDRDNIPISVLERLKPYVDNPDLNVDKIKKVSLSFVSLWQWIESTYQYGILVHKLKSLDPTHPLPQAHAARTLAKTEKKIQSLPSPVPPAKEKRSSFIEVSDTDTIDSVKRDLEIASRKSLQISKISIGEIKATSQKPPQICKTILEAYAILFKHSGERMYEKALRCFSLKNITSFDRDNIPISVLERLKPYVDNPDLNVDKIKKVSSCFVSLWQWIESTYQYGILVHKLKSLRANL